MVSAYQNSKRTQVKPWSIIREYWTRLASQAKIYLLDTIIDFRSPFIRPPTDFISLVGLDSMKLYT